MTMTIEKFIKLTNAEEVAGNLIVGIMSTRKIVGSVTDGVFSFNDEGKKIIEELEAPKEAVEVVAEAKPAKAAK